MQFSVERQGHMAWVLVNLSFMTDPIFCYWYYYPAIHFSHDSASVAFALPNLVVAFNLCDIIQLSRKSSACWETQWLFNDSLKMSSYDQEQCLKYFAKNTFLSQAVLSWFHPGYLGIHHQIFRSSTGRCADTVDTEGVWQISYLLPYLMAAG